MRGGTTSGNSKQCIKCNTWRDTQEHAAQPKTLLKMHPPPTNDSQEIPSKIYPMPELSISSILACTYISTYNINLVRHKRTRTQCKRGQRTLCRRLKAIEEEGEEVEAKAWETVLDTKTITKPEKFSELETMDKVEHIQN